MNVDDPTRSELFGLIETRSSILMEREWAMPNKRTFQIKPIGEFLEKCLKGRDRSRIVDPFSGDSELAGIRNDLRFGGMDALEFLRGMPDESVSTLLFDPPYSLRQLKECYDGIGRAMSGRESQRFFSDLKDEVARVVRPYGMTISFGWTSQGMGINRGFTIQRILLVAHGGIHNDTICVMERKG